MTTISFLAIAKLVIGAALAAIPLLFGAFRRVVGFLAAERSVFGMLITGLVLVFTGQAWSGVLLIAKGAFLLFAAAFGFQLTTTGVNLMMPPLMGPPIHGDGTTPPPVAPTP